MIAEVTGRGRRGSDTKGLLRYLFGPGRANEHIDPHIVAGWAPEWVRGHPLGGDLAESACSAAGRAKLAAQLDGLMTGHGVDVDGGHVYHVVLSLPPADLPVDPATGERRRLPDEVWRELAESGIAALGLAPDDRGRNGCRWVAVHHGPSANGNDHVHLVVNTVRANGDIANLYRDFFRWRDWCRAVEDRYHWTATAPAGQGATRATTRRELTRATATNPPTERERLRAFVATAAATTRTEQDFVEALRNGGVLLAAYPSTPADSKPVVTGYKAAIAPIDGQEAVWFAGSTLRRDLSLPKLRERWNVELPPTMQHELWREHRSLLNRVEPVFDLAALANLGDAALAATTAALDHPNPDPHTWHRIAERAADIALALTPHDATTVLAQTHTHLVRAAQPPPHRPPLAGNRSRRNLRSTEPLDVAMRALTHFARSVARTSTRTENSAPVVLALGLTLVLLVVIALRDNADRHRIRTAARGQTDTAARLLESHSARTPPPPPGAHPAREPGMNRPQKAANARPWRPPITPNTPRGRGR